MVDNIVSPEELNECKWFTRCDIIAGIKELLGSKYESGAGPAGYCKTDSCFINIIVSDLTTESSRPKKLGKNCNTIEYSVSAKVRFELTSPYSEGCECLCDDMEKHIIECMNKGFGRCFEVQNVAFEISEGSHSGSQKTTIQSTIALNRSIIVEEE